MNAYINNPFYVNKQPGQLTVIGILMIFLSIMVLSALSDTITSTTHNMSDNLTAAGYAEEGMLINLAWLFIIVTLLATIATYGTPQV